MDQHAASDRDSARKSWWWIFDPRLSLRARGALAFGGGTLALTLTLSWICGTVYQRALQSQVGNTFETLAAQVSDKLDRSIYERYRTLILAAGLNSTRLASTDANERRRVLEALQEATPEFAWIGLADGSGRVVAATGRLFEGTDASVRTWFRAAQDRPHLAGLRQLPELAREIPTTPDGDAAPRFLEIAVPVLGPDGKFAGVIAAHVSWAWAREVQLSVVSELAARDRVGVTVYQGADVLLDSGALGWTYPPDAPSVGEGSRFRGWMLEKTAVGPVFMTGFARSRGVREYRGIGWLTLVRQPIERVLAPVVPVRRSIILWGGVLAVAAGIAGWIFAGRHAHRLRTVGGAAERIREGDILAVLPHPTDESELSTMCRSLSNLVEDLRGKQETLRAENARLAAHAKDHETVKR